MLPPEPDLTNPDEVLVRVEGVSKKFCRSLKKSLWYGAQDIAAELNPFGRKVERLKDENLNFDPVSDQESRFEDESTLRDGEFWAVKEVSFELRRGECLGLIGHNGAGKTTLLKMLNGLIKPDRGTITMRGRVGALIALGAGFNPILTGRENIYVNGSVLGLSKKEIDEKIDEIIDFAEIGEFIDSPVQSYSSGMQVRLGFAVATAMEPDVLILDEVLAVGDAAFRAKCFSRIGKMQKNCAILFVSHSMDQVARLCTMAVHLEFGRASIPLEVSRAAQKYESRTRPGDDPDDPSFERITSPIKRISYTCPKSIEIGNNLALQFTIEASDPVLSSYFRIVFFSLCGTHSAELNSEFAKLSWTLEKGRNDFIMNCEHLSLRPGHYKIGLMYFHTGNIDPIIWLYKTMGVEITGPRLGLAYYALTRANITKLPTKHP
jgi:lipopolysaccharide transport system ATP-binding protein